MAEPKRGSVAAFKAAEERRKARINKASAPKSNARKEAFNKKVASINKSRTDQGSVSKFKAAEERRQQRLAKVNTPKYGSPKMKKQRAMADVEKDLPKAKTTTGKIAGTSVAAMGKDRVGNRAGKVAAAGKTAAPKAAPKAEASTPKKSADLSGFGAAFKKARAEGVGTKFAYNDKQYAAVTKDDISRAGKSSLKEFLESSKRKATTELAKAPGQIVKKRYGGRISVKQEDIKMARKKASDEAKQRNIDLKNYNKLASTPKGAESEKARILQEKIYGRVQGGMISDERKKRIAEMMRKQKEQSTQKRKLNREDFEKIKGVYEKLERTPVRPMPMDPNMQREAKPMPMRPGVRPEGKKYERPIGRPELKERPMRRSGAAISEGEMQSFMEQMNKPRSMDRFKSGGSVMARGCKMGRKKATKLY